jgi:hypothetical protein
MGIYIHNTITMNGLFFLFYYEVLPECSWTVVVVTASVKDERGGQGHTSASYCISLPCDTAL